MLGRTMEYEVVDTADRGTEIALTWLRAVGYLSRNVHPYRSEPAGPQLPTPHAQVLGPCRASIAVVPHRGDWAHADLGAVAEAVLHPVVVRHGAAAADTPLASVEGLSVTGADVDLLSLRRRLDGDRTVEVRVLGASDEPTTAVVGSPNRPVLQACTVSGRGIAGDPVDVTDGVVTLALGPWQIVTLRVTLRVDVAAPFGA